jgi:hypothetical protein
MFWTRLVVELKGDVLGKFRGRGFVELRVRPLCLF